VNGGIAEPQISNAGQKADFAAPKICLLANKERKTCEEPVEPSKMPQLEDFSYIILYVLLYSKAFIYTYNTDVIPLFCLTYAIF